MYCWFRTGGGLTNLPEHKVGAEKAAGIIGCPVPVAQEMLTKWRESTPATQELKKRTWKEARENEGVLHTLYGRRLVYPDICIPFISWEERKAKRLIEWNGVYLSADELSSRRADAERQIFNALIQGTAADIFKILCNRSTPKILSLGGKPILNVHDEYIAEVPRKQAENAKQVLNGIFNLPPERSLLPGLPLKGESKIGNSWLECK